MAYMSKLVGELPEGYGYVVLTGVGNVFLNMWFAINVGKARKQYEVKYPQLYHSEPGHKFNCVQRVHQNQVEQNANFMFILLVGGLQYPKISAAAGAVYLIGRIAYALGYYTGDPDKRKYGAIAHLGELCLLGNVISFAFHRLGWWPCK